MLIPQSSKRQFNWVSDVFYFMKKSALVFELCHVKDTYVILQVKIVNYPFRISVGTSVAVSWFKINYSKGLF